MRFGKGRAHASWVGATGPVTRTSRWHPGSAKGAVIIVCQNLLLGRVAEQSTGLSLSKPCPLSGLESTTTTLITDAAIVALTVRDHEKMRAIGVE